MDQRKTRIRVDKHNRKENDFLKLILSEVSGADRRLEILAHVGGNLFKIPSRDVVLDLLTDSGTCGLSPVQLEKRQKLSDSSYAGSASTERLLCALHDIFCFPYVIFTPQGRGAERVFNAVVLDGKEKYVVGNTPFDTTRYNIEANGGTIIDCTKTGTGEVDINQLDYFLQKHHKDTAYIIVTITCNSRGGLPVSLTNLSEIKLVAKKYGLMFVLDAARYAENAYFEWELIDRKRYDESFTIKEIITLQTGLADCVCISFKKDALAHGGGAIMLRSKESYEKMLEIAVGEQGGENYGAIPPETREEIAQGLYESLDINYLITRVQQVRNLSLKLRNLGIPCIHGGHSVSIDAGALLPHLRWDQFPAHALALTLYLVGGIRSCDVGSLMLGRDQKSGENRKAYKEMLRLAIPRRRYTDNELNRVCHAFAYLKKTDLLKKIPGVSFKQEASVLRHFRSTYHWG